MIIQHNIRAMNSYRSYNNNTSALSKNLEKLSSGYKINRASDDAAGLAISEKMRTQITGMEAAQKNVKDGVSLVKTAEGAMEEIHSMLKRMDYLATQSANGTYDNETDRDQLQKEIDQLESEINRIADSSNFNGIRLLDGSLSGRSQVNNLDISTTTAQNGYYKTDVGALFTDDADPLTTADIGKSIDYTVTWKDANGTERTTTISLTFMGDGNGGVIPADNNYSQYNNYYEANGKRYYLGGSGANQYTLEPDVVAQVIVDGLKADDAFSSHFTVSANVIYEGNNVSRGAIEMEARKEGSAGAVVLSLGVNSNLSATMYDNSFYRTFNSKIEIHHVPQDSMQRFNIGNLGVADSTLNKLKDIEKLIFEIDGHKFLLNQKAPNGLNDDMLRTLGGDVTIIPVSSPQPLDPAVETKNIAAEVTRVTGMETSGFVGPDDTGAPNRVSGDVIFTQDTLKLSGSELRLQIGDTSEGYNQMSVKIKDLHTSAIGVSGMDISTQDAAASVLDSIKAAINYVSDVRGTLGATQNRLDHTMNNLSIMTENVQDAESTIRDTDVAEEMMSYVKNNILVQSAQSMLAQANQIPQGVLQLLG